MEDKLFPIHGEVPAVGRGWGWGDAQADPARIDRGSPADPHRLPTLLRVPALSPPGLRPGPRDDSARLRTGPGLGLPRPSFDPPWPGQPAAGPRLRSAAAAARAVRAPTEPRTQRAR